MEKHILLKCFKNVSLWNLFTAAFLICIIMSNGILVFNNKCCSIIQNFAGVNKYNVKLLKRNESPNVTQKAAVDGPCTGGKVGSSCWFPCASWITSVSNRLYSCLLLCKFMFLTDTRQSGIALVTV